MNKKEPIKAIKFFDKEDIRNVYHSELLREFSRAKRKISDDIARSIKKDIIDGMSEVDIMKKYDLSRHIVQDIRSGKTYRDVFIWDDLPEIEHTNHLTEEDADHIGKLLSENKTTKEISEITGFSNHTINDIKNGKKYPRIKNKYQLTNTKKYTDIIDDNIVKDQIIPAILSGKYKNDKEVAKVFGCKYSQIRDIRLKRRRKNLTEGIDFTDCYEKG